MVFLHKTHWFSKNYSAEKVSCVMRDQIPVLIQYLCQQPPSPPKKLVVPGHQLSPLWKLIVPRHFSGIFEWNLSPCLGFGEGRHGAGWYMLFWQPTEPLQYKTALLFASDLGMISPQMFSVGRFSISLELTIPVGVGSIVSERRKCQEIGKPWALYQLAFLWS